MNLVDEGWIPVVTYEGKPYTASLMEIFTKGNEYADLSVRPHERISLMRLLICIAQAALDGPKDADEWDEAPKNLAIAAEKYLTDKKDLFNLFDSEKPFLQIAKLEKIKKEQKPKENPKTKTNKHKDEVLEENEKTTSVSKLDITLSSGSNSTIFDHDALDDENRIFSLSHLPIALITYLNFSASGRIGVAKWNSIETLGNGSSFPGLCIDGNMIHSFIRKESIYLSICYNLLTKKSVERHFGKSIEWGVPVWEKMPESNEKSEAVTNATETYLGRLVPLSRAIKISNDQKNIILANGLKFSMSKENIYETTVTVKADGRKRKPLKVSDRAIWRELHSITIKNYSEKQNTCGPKALENVGNSDFDLWCGGVLWSNKGGYLNLVESVYHIPANMVLNVVSDDQSGSQKNDVYRSYENEIDVAEKMNKRINKAIEIYRKNIDGYWATRSDPKHNRDAWKVKNSLHSKATRHYWTLLEKQRYLLMNHVSSIGTTTGEQVDQTRKVWHAAIFKAANESYSIACGQETPRQIRAYALGLKALCSKPKNDDDRDSEQDNEEGEEA